MRIQVQVKPKSGRQSVSVDSEGLWTVHLKSPPADGEANAELIVAVAAHLGIPKSRVSIKSGASSRRKVLEVED